MEPISRRTSTQIVKKIHKISKKPCFFDKKGHKSVFSAGLTKKRIILNINIKY